MYDALYIYIYVTVNVQNWRMPTLTGECEHIPNIYQIPR